MTRLSCLGLMAALLWLEHTASFVCAGQELRPETLSASSHPEGLPMFGMSTGAESKTASKISKGSKMAIEQQAGTSFSGSMFCLPAS